MSISGKNICHNRFLISDGCISRSKNNIGSQFSHFDMLHIKDLKKVPKESLLEKAQYEILYIVQQYFKAHLLILLDYT